MNFTDQSIYNKMFHQVVHKGEELEINYIKISQNANALANSVGNRYTEDKLMHTLL